MAKENLFITKRGHISTPPHPFKLPFVVIRQGPLTTLPKALNQAKKTLPGSWVEKKGKPAHVPHGTKITSKK